MKTNRIVVVFVAVFILVFVRRAALAQGRASVRTQPIVANVELVQVPVIVFDERGAVATNLKKNDFRILDDGVVQQITYFEKVSTPVSFVILADLSSSMTRKIPFVQEAALALLEPLDQQDHFDDEYSVLGIGKRANRLVPFTRDKQDLERRLPLLLTATNESTALFDGIYLGVTTVRQDAANQRRAMIIISDGGDNHSIYNIHETKQLLEEADVPVFAVMAGSSFELPEIFTRKDKKPAARGSWPQFPGLPVGGSNADYIGPAERHGPHNLSVLTEVTGGGVFTAAHEEDLPRIVQTIGQAMRYQYLLAYTPLRTQDLPRKRAKNSDDNARHKIQVELYPKENFKGYSVPYYKGRYSSTD